MRLWGEREEENNALPYSPQILGVLASEVTVQSTTERKSSAAMVASSLEEDWSWSPRVSHAIAGQPSSS